MYIAADHAFAKAVPNGETDAYPSEVRRLFPREREIAVIVYDGGLVTANEVLARLSSPLTNPALRSMLNRLVRKGVLTRQLLGIGRVYVYAPAVTASSTRQSALEQFAEDFHAGSLSALADAIADMLARERAHDRHVGRAAAQYC
jgi:predicted transcriptional regulator